MRREAVVERIRQTMRAIEPGAQTILFGSESRGDATADSDIDLLILVNEKSLSPEREMNITGRLYEIELSTGVIISPIITTRSRWEQRPFDTPFAINVMNEGIRI